MNATCSIDGCEQQRSARGWCKKHHQRWLRHRDPLAIRRPQPAQDFLRDVVFPYEGKDCLFWPFATNKDGYGIVWQGTVHRIVCERRNGPPPTPEHEAAHSCGNGHLACVAGHHLSWKTHVENMAYRIPHGTHSRGERCGKAKLTEDEVRAIRVLTARMPQGDIAKIFGVSSQHISKIQSDQQWSHLKGAKS